MNVIQKAIKYNKRTQQNNNVPAELKNSKLVSGCYGIDSLFTNKSKKISFKEFLNGIKDVLLISLMFASKVISAAFGILKRPGYALIAFFIFLIGIIFIFMRDDATPREKNIAAIQNSNFLLLNDDNAKSAPSEVIPEANAQTTGFVPASTKNIKNNLRFSHAFESKVRDFCCKHNISDIMCKNGCCRLKS